MILPDFAWTRDDERQRGRTLVNRRPTYKLVGKERFLYYGTNGMWWISPDTSKDAGWWKATSKALTPDRITETWEETDSDRKWHPVASAKVVRR